jgi:signal transduction histidine kinase
MEQQGGSLEVKSRFGEGTRVIINLPVNAESAPVMNEAHRA